ncbi:MAG: single-stranded DNA-binding protein [Candidatus Gastranaerophilales bacterium]|nr:single-stranded DNA-binding protein [Candidatus Gastranaerophilales bacterium]
MVNSAVIVGRVGQDPEMKYFDSGKVKVTFSVAVNRWDSRTKEEITDWFPVELWDKQAEIAGEWVKKGSLVGIEGRLSSNKWTTPDGESLERFIIRCTNLRLLGSKKDEN